MVATNVAGCAAQQHPLTATAAAGLKGRQVAMTERRPPRGSVSVPGKSTFNAGGMAGALGVLAAMSAAGARIARENSVADSTPYVAGQLSDDIQRRYGLEPAQQRLAISDNDAPTEITAAHPSADLVLDVRTGWSLQPISHNSSKYYLTYIAHLRLIDAKIVHFIDGKKGAVIADGTCSHSTDDTARAPSYDEFLAQKAQRLKDEIGLAARFCVDEFRAKVLTIGPPQ
jgi:hypothetical protein